MFYSQCLVSKNRPLGTIWVAAYFFKKLKKAQIKDTNIPSSIDQILQKELDALAYRVLAYLLLGVVRIYSKKVDFLFDDCNKVLIGVKEFVAKEKNKENTTTLLLPSTSRCFSIALPARFELDAFDLEILEDFHGSNVKPQEDITLKGGQETKRMDLYAMERFDMEDNYIENHDMDIDAEPLYFIESSKDHRNVCEHSEKPELDDMLVDLQMSEEAAVKVIEAVLLNSHESSRDHQNGFEHKEDTESDKTLMETRWETMRNAESFLDECRSPETTHRIEEQPSGTSRIYEDKETPEMNTLQEPEPEPGSVSEISLHVSNNRDLLEKRQGHSDEERSEFEMFRESQRESSEGLHNDSEKVCLFDANLSEESSKWLNSKVTNTPETPSRLRIPEGDTSLQFSIIPTPAAKEVSRITRKRKCLIDEEVVISSRVMKKMIEDSSGLVKKRGKAPRTAYLEWRNKRFANPSQCFLDPLISYASLDLKLLSSQPIKIKEQNTPGTSKTSNRIESFSLGTIRTRGSVLRAKQIANPQETMETPQAITDPETVAEVCTEMESRLTVSGIANQTDITPETPLRSSEQRYNAPETPLVSEQIEIAPETPVRESKSVRYFKDLDKETRPSSSFTSFDNQTAMFSDLDAVLMHEEGKDNSHEGEDLQQDTLSTRTRNVANFLEKTFQEQREKEEEEKVSLLQLCRQRTRKESARLFYETLVLKIKGYLEVKQDYPYSDILITKQQQQQQKQKLD